MKVVRTISTCYEHCYDYDFIFDEIKLRFFYGGNNDIYFSVWPLDADNDISQVTLRFTKENYEVYERFYDLYHALLTGDIYKEEEVEQENIELLDFELAFNNYFNRTAKERNDEARRYSRWNDFAKDGVISLMSDNCEEDYSNRLNIYLDGETLVFYFEKRNPCDMFLTFEISTSGSRYQPFHKVFMDLYNRMQEVDPDNIKNHLNENIHSLRKKD